MRARGSITGPLVLIAIGILFLIHAITPEFRVGELLAQNWPYILIIWGVVALLEVLIRGWRGDPIPANGISGAGWLLVIVICIAGLLTFEVRRPDNWWRQAGWERGIEAFGQTHDFTIEPIQRTTGATPHILIESFRGDAKIAKLYARSRRERRSGRIR
jgi:hypothetical protein